MEADFSQTTRLAADLGKVGPRVVKQVRQAVELATRGTEREAKMFAPVDTGTLRNSITSDLRGLTGTVGPTVEYGAHVEYGTSRMAPHAYMGPAFDRNAAVFMQALKAINPGIGT